jgi:hypothetical protein
MSCTSLEPLEHRLLLAASLNPASVQWGDRSVSLHRGLLTIRGGDTRDRISSSTSFPSGFPISPGSDGSGDSQLNVHINRNTASFPFAKIRWILIDGGGGDDLIEMQPEPFQGCWLFSPILPRVHLLGLAG